MSKRWKWGMLAIVLAAGLSAVFMKWNEKAADAKQTLLVSAAASLQDSLERIAVIYEKQHPGIDVVFNYGASGTLQKQIEQGAPADLFFSAGAKQMDALVENGQISSSLTLLNNKLVLIVPSTSEAEIASLAGLVNSAYQTIAIGQPESVPAGEYTQQALKNDHVWDTLQGKLVFAKDVRQVLTYVETGNTDAGFVYATDALASGKVKIALTVDPKAHQPIQYPVGIVKNSKLPAEAERFYEFLQSSEAEQVFKDSGFQRVQS